MFFYNCADNALIHAGRCWWRPRNNYPRQLPARALRAARLFRAARFNTQPPRANRRVVAEPIPPVAPNINTRPGLSPGFMPPQQHLVVLPAFDGAFAALGSEAAGCARV